MPLMDGVATIVPGELIEFLGSGAPCINY